MSSIVLHCPGCQQAYQMSPEQAARYAGKTITCRKCQVPFAFDAAYEAALRRRRGGRGAARRGRRAGPEAAGPAGG